MRAGKAKSPTLFGQAVQRSVARCNASRPQEGDMLSLTMKSGLIITGVTIALLGYLILLIEIAY
jgi:hypothetical protein